MLSAITIWCTWVLVLQWRRDFVGVSLYGDSLWGLMGDWQFFEFTFVEDEIGEAFDGNIIGFF